MKKKKLHIIILILIIILLSSLSYRCGGPGPFGFDLWFLDDFMKEFHKQESSPGDDAAAGNIVGLPKEFSTKNESGDLVEEINPPLKESLPIPDYGEIGIIVYPGGGGSLSVGHNPNIDFTQIVQSASEPPEDQIPVVEMPQETPDLPKQDDRTTIADADQQPEDSSGQPGDKSPIPTKPDIKPADEPEGTTDTTEEQPSYGEQEQPHHEHDILVYYEDDIYPDSDNKLSITINVNVVTGEVDGHYDFSGFIGSSGERSAIYDFSSYLDSNDYFSATSTATIYEDGQDIGEATLTISGELSNDMSLIAGEIVDTSMGGLAIVYYAYLISQTEEQPEKENY
jgi:hypothetical protein